MSSDETPDDDEIIPFTNQPLFKEIEKYNREMSETQDIKAAECEIRDLVWLKRAGLTYDEIELYQATELELLELSKDDPESMNIKLENALIKMIFKFEAEGRRTKDVNTPGVTLSEYDNLYKAYQGNPAGYPIKRIAEIEVVVVEEEDGDERSEVTKLVLRFQIKITRIKDHNKQVLCAVDGLDIPTMRHKDSCRLYKMLQQHEESLGNHSTKPSPYHKFKQRKPLKDQFQRHFSNIVSMSPKNSLEFPPRNRNDYHPGEISFSEDPETWKNRYIKDGHLLSPQVKPQYAVYENNRVVRLDEDPTVDIPIEEQRLEGTKISLQRIMQMRKFKNFTYNALCKVLLLKNIAQDVTEEKLTLLFNQFLKANKEPILVHIEKNGPEDRKKKALVVFANSRLSGKALLEVNGTILNGHPVVANFAKRSQIARLDAGIY